MYAPDQRHRVYSLSGWHALAALVALAMLVIGVDPISLTLRALPGGNRVLLLGPFVLFALTSALATWRQPAARAALFGVPRPWRMVLRIGVALWLLAFVGIALWENLSPTARAASDTVAASLGLGQSLGHDLMVIWAVTVLAPITEELFFRGLLMGGLRAALGRWLPPRVALVGAVVGSALLFGLSHGGEGQQDQLAMLVLMGGLLGLAFALSGTLMVPVLIHALNNSAAAIAEFALEDGGMLVAPWLGWVILLSPALACGGLWALRRL